MIEGIEVKELKKTLSECWHGFKALGTKPEVLLNFPTRLYNYEKPDEESCLQTQRKYPTIADWRRD